MNSRVEETGGERLVSLRRRHHVLASSVAQQKVLEGALGTDSFDEKLSQYDLPKLQAKKVEILQINVGKKCNQTCQHCHVDAGPDRTETMSNEVLDACLRWVESGRVYTLDVTGGAPELHPRFREIVERSHAAKVEVIDRCNLTILQTKKYFDLPEFLAAHEVQIAASLPWYSRSRTDAQRGDGVFEDSIAAIRRLNALGYGDGTSGRVLNLVTNPVGNYLFDDPAALESHYKSEMQRRFGIRFDRLFAITNMPVSRYLEHLVNQGQLEAYLEKLRAAFNPASVRGLMCRNTLSVGWDGRLYDCDFNQMLELEIPGSALDVDLDSLSGRKVRTLSHCFGCTAGRGSSCGGAVT